MYSTGHIIFIAISIIVIFLGVSICKNKNIATERVIWICFFIGLTCELIKIFTVLNMVPVLEIVNENGILTYKNIGKYSPYIETEHMPFELCSLQIIFFFLARVTKNEKWKRRIYSLIYGTATIGGFLAIILSSIAPQYKSTSEFLLSLRAWEFYLYHAMIMIVAIVIALDKKIHLKFSDAKWTCIIVIMLDIFSVYMNSIFSVPIYSNRNLIGLTYSVNFFSSYDNPFGLVLTTKSEYLIYIAIRFLIGLFFVLLVYTPFLKRKKV